MALKGNNKEENFARDQEIYAALTALTPWRPSEQIRPDFEYGGLDSFRFVKGIPNQSWVRDGDPIIQDNSFWRAFAKAHGGNQSLWPVYKYQVHQYLTDILDEKNINIRRTHPRAVVYTVLNGFAGGRSEAHLKNKPADLIAQTTDSDSFVTSELYQVVADLYSVELITIFLQDHATPDKPHSVLGRGQHNHRQIFLTYYQGPDLGNGFRKAFYQPVLPAVPEPWDWKFEAHMQGDRVLVNATRCPFVFAAGKVGERAMPGAEGLPRVPPPPIIPPPVPVAVQNCIGAFSNHFAKYTGPIGDGKNPVPETESVVGLSKRNSTKGRRSRTSSIVGLGRSNSKKADGTPVKTANPPSDGVSRPPVSKYNNKATGRSEDPFRGTSPSPAAKPVARSGSTSGNRPPFSTGRSRTPSIGAGSATPTARKTSGTSTPVRQSSTSGRTSATPTRKTSIGTASKPATKPPSGTGRPTRTPISKVPAPPQSTRRNSFSRPEVICRIRTPPPPEESGQESLPGIESGPGLEPEPEPVPEPENEPEPPRKQKHSLTTASRQPRDKKKPPSSWATAKQYDYRQYGDAPQSSGKGGEWDDEIF